MVVKIYKTKQKKCQSEKQISTKYCQLIIYIQIYKVVSPFKLTDLFKGIVCIALSVSAPSLYCTWKKNSEMRLFCSHMFGKRVRGKYSSSSAHGCQRSSSRWERCRCLPLETSLSPCSESRTPLGEVEEAFCQAQSAPPSQGKWWHDRKCRQTRREGETGSVLCWCADVRASVSTGNLEFANSKNISARLKDSFSA